MITRIIRSLRFVEPTAAFVLGAWVLLFPLLWVAARFFPRRRDRVIFWTNQGFNVAPSRVRSYFMCREFSEQGGNARILSFWDDILDYHGLLPVNITLARRSLAVFKAVWMTVKDRAGIIVAQAPLYDVIGLASLKLLYPFSLSIWTDFDDWLFDDVSFDGSEASIKLRDVLALHVFASRGCIVSSLPLEREMSRYFKRVEIIPTFPNAGVFRPPADIVPTRSENKIIFSWTGTFLMTHVVSDIMFLLTVLDSLGDDRVVFEVVGDGHYLEDARGQATKVARNVTVSFRGWIDPESMPDYVAGIDVGLYCLRNRDHFAISKSPTKLFEYMACAKPTVSTNHGEAPRFIEHGETGFLAADFDDFAQCCKRLVNDPELRLSMGLKARARIEEEYNVAEGVRSLRRVLFD